MASLWTCWDLSGSFRDLDWGCKLSLARETSARSGRRRLTRSAAMTGPSWWPWRRWRWARRSFDKNNNSFVCWDFGIIRDVCWSEDINGVSVVPPDFKWELTRHLIGPGPQIKASDWLNNLWNITGSLSVADPRIWNHYIILQGVSQNTPQYC